MKAPAFSATGTKAADVTLEKSVFGMALNQQLIKEAYQIYLGNQRTNNAMTLTRGKVSGGGKKPWRQKGTGRARTGSIRNPIWRGGGITFGPTGEENYRRSLPKNMAQMAILSALSAKAEAKNIVVIEEFKATEGKVKPTIAMLGKLGVEGNIVIVVDKTNKLLERATRNIVGVDLVVASNLNIFQVVNADSIVITKKAQDALKERFAGVKVGAAS